MIVSIVTFKLPPGADREAFLAADKAMQEEVLYHRAGFVRRTVAYSSERDEWAAVSFSGSEPVLDIVDGHVDGSTVVHLLLHRYRRLIRVHCWTRVRGLSSGSLMKAMVGPPGTS